MAGCGGRNLSQRLLDPRSPVNAFQIGRERSQRIASAAHDKYPLFPRVWGMGRFPVTNSIYINHAGTRVFGETRLDASDPEDLFKVNEVVKGVDVAGTLEETGCKMTWPT